MENKTTQKTFNFKWFRGYIVPKNDEFFNENVQINKDRLKKISNFKGSAGFAIILQKRIIFLWMEDILCKRKNNAKESLK